VLVAGDGAAGFVLAGGGFVGVLDAGRGGAGAGAGADGDGGEPVPVWIWRSRRV
jgi:hypothetical protein